MEKKDVFRLITPLKATLGIRSGLAVFPGAEEEGLDSKWRVLYISTFDLHVLDMNMTADRVNGGNK